MADIRGGTIFKRTWQAPGIGGRRVKRTTFGFTFMANGTRVRKVSSEWHTRQLAQDALDVYKAEQRNPTPAAPPTPSSMTLAQATHRFLDAKSRSRETTRRDYTRIARHLEHAFGPETPLSTITANRISQYQEARLVAVSRRRRNEAGDPMPLSLAAINRPLAVLRAILRMAHRKWELLGKVPVIELQREPGRVRWLGQYSPDEEARLLDACRASANPHLLSIVTTALETGMRQREIMTLRWEQIDFSQNVIRLDAQDTKTKEPRVVPMRRAVYDALSTLPEPHTGRLWPFRFPRAAWESAVARAGLRDFHFHDCRHHFASWFMKRGGNLLALQRILGHSTLAMTSRYAHHDTASLQAEMTRTEAVLTVHGTFMAHGGTIEPASPVSTRHAGVAQRQSN